MLINALVSISESVGMLLCAWTLGGFFLSFDFEFLCCTHTYHCHCSFLHNMTFGLSHNSQLSLVLEVSIWFLEARSLKMICFSAEVADDINSFALGGSLGPCVKLISSCSSVFFCFLFWNLPISPFGFCAFGGDCLREPEGLFPSWLNISLHPPLTGLVRLQLPCLYTSLDLSRLSFLTEWIVSVMLTVSVFDI